MDFSRSDAVAELAPEGSRLSLLNGPAAESTRVDHETTMEVDDETDVSSRPEAPSALVEDTIGDDPIPHDIAGTDDDVTTYQLIDGATRAGNTLLVDSNGYTYNKKSLGKKQRPGKTTWRCSVRSKKLTCPAKVLQDGECFSRGLNSHVHPGDPCAAAKARVTSKVKAAAVDSQNLFTPASTLVDNAMAQEDPETLPAPGNVARAANRLRQQLRPNEPAGCDFDISMEHIPDDFLVEDIRVEGARHIVFSAPHQQELLGKAKTWYCDGTFKIVREPFHQLFCVHAFVKGGIGNVKQVPLVFVYMTRRRTKDYKKVFKALKRCLGSHKLRKVVMDFEWAAWKATKSVFPDVTIQGCVFHFTQALWKKCQELGLAVPYKDIAPVRTFIKRLMALPYIPSDHIMTTFEALVSTAPEGPCQDLATYVRATWIQGNWCPADWSVYQCSVRTNNDVEGWHRRLNGLAGSRSQPFYVSVPLLHREAETVRRQVKLVKEGKLQRYQRVTYRRLQGRFFTLWDQYEARDLTTKQLLRACSHLTGPTNWSPTSTSFPGTYGFPAKDIPIPSLPPDWPDHLMLLPFPGPTGSRLRTSPSHPCHLTGPTTWCYFLSRDLRVPG